MSANDRQVGGSHYQSSTGIQHWDVVELYGIGYLEAAATKYLQRNKDPAKRLQDLEKSYHYTEKLLELHRTHRRAPRGCVPLHVIVDFCHATNVSVGVQQAIQLLFRWRDEMDLKLALAAIKVLIANEHDAQAEQEAATSA